MRFINEQNALRIMYKDFMICFDVNALDKGLNYAIINFFQTKIFSLKHIYSPRGLTNIALSKSLVK